jgi:hypothetical protein
MPSANMFAKCMAEFFYSGERRGNVLIAGYVTVPAKQLADKTAGQKTANVAAPSIDAYIGHSSSNE